MDNYIVDYELDYKRHIIDRDKQVIVKNITQLPKRRYTTRKKYITYKKKKIKRTKKIDTKKIILKKYLLLNINKKTNRLNGNQIVNLKNLDYKKAKGIILTDYDIKNSEGISIYTEKIERIKKYFPKNLKSNLLTFIKDCNMVKEKCGKTEIKLIY